VDVNLKGEPIDGLLTALRQEGVPFAFVTVSCTAPRCRRRRLKCTTDEEVMQWKPPLPIAFR
jgi:hypothetical protein